MVCCGRLSASRQARSRGGSPAAPSGAGIVEKERSTSSASESLDRSFCLFFLGGRCETYE